MAVMLHDWVELSLKDFFYIRVDDPLFAPTAFAEDNVKEIVEFVVVFKVVFSPCLVLEFSIFLHDEIITEFIDGDQTLQTGIHIAVICVVVETNDPIFERGLLLVLFNDIFAL